MHSLQNRDVVRREELIDELRADGGDAVLIDSENLPR